MKKLLFCGLLALLAVLLALPVLAHPTTVYDDADFLTDEEEAALAAACDCDSNVQFYFVTNSSQMTSREVEGRCGLGEDADAVVLVIDKTGGKYYYEMFTYNGADKMFSDRDVDAILDAPTVYNNIKSGNLYDGCEAFVGLSRQRAEDAAAQATEKEKKAPLTAVLVGVVVAVLTGGGAVVGVFLYYRRKQHGESYPLDRYANMHLTEQQDRFMGSFVTRVRVQSSSGSGGVGGGASGGSRGRR